MEISDCIECPCLNTKEINQTRRRACKMLNKQIKENTDAKEKKKKKQKKSRGSRDKAVPEI